MSSGEMNVSFCIFICYELFVICTSLPSYDEKPVLKPVELIDLILEERLRKEIASTDILLLKVDAETSHNQFTGKPVRRTDVTTEAISNMVGGVTRKVWSRWSKWSECSATCGDGAAVRRRLCVAGRCARGEREEQQRLCRKPPCEQTENMAVIGIL